MSLGTRLTLKTAAGVLAVLVVAAVALWGLGGLSRDLDAALGQYDRLRVAYELSADVEQVRSALRGELPDPQRARAALQRVLLRVEERADKLDRRRAAELRDSLASALAALDEDTAPVPRIERAADLLNGSINILLSEIDNTSTQIRTIEHNASSHRARVVLWVGVTASIAALLAIIVGVWQYLAVMRPLRRLGRGVERLAAGDFADRLAATGDREFVRLSSDFNQMADDLAQLYHQLEDKVRLRSAQLAQSERLASVGFLAAGVAHEINNPLAIIAGEAELALNAIAKHDGDRDSDDASRETLTAIRDEAFRCKAITQKLLSLASPGSGERQRIKLNAIADEVADLVRTLPQHEGRRVLVEAPQDVTATTNASQVKQVLLNLVINALEATGPGNGVVRIVVGQSPDHALLAVKDNGKGIEPEALGRVFEPFYTEKKSPTTPGLGLGLSISHAIIEDLGGRLTAASAGPGNGSTFTIELPMDR